MSELLAAVRRVQDEGRSRTTIPTGFLRQLITDEAGLRYRWERDRLRSLGMGHNGAALKASLAKWDWVRSVYVS
jgi:hypothetical protein